MTPTEKLKLWEIIQRVDPKLAEALKLVAKHFGKPEFKLIRVKEAI